MPGVLHDFDPACSLDSCISNQRGIEERHLPRARAPWLRPWGKLITRARASSYTQSTVLAILKTLKPSSPLSGEGHDNVGILIGRSKDGGVLGVDQFGGDDTRVL